MTNYIGQSLSSVKQSRKFSEIIEATEISFHGNLAFRISKYSGTNKPPKRRVVFAKQIHVATDVF